MEKSIKFIPSKGGNLFVFNLGLVLLPAEIAFVIEKQSWKGNTLGPYSNGSIKIVFTIAREVVALHVGNTIV